jgi:hypothetical protein
MFADTMRVFLIRKSRSNEVKMFEEKKSEEGRSFAVRLFSEFPWVVRAYFHILVIFIIALIAMGIADAKLGIPQIGPVIEKMTGFLELIVGAVVGALSAAVKQTLEKKR